MANRPPTTRAERRRKTPVTLPARFEPKFFEQADGRAAIVRSIKKKVARLKKESDAKSYEQEILCQRAIHLALLIERLELGQVGGESIDAGLYERLVRSESRVLARLGFKPGSEPKEEEDDWE